jgi:hypothetical protein
MKAQFVCAALVVFLSGGGWVFAQTNSTNTAKIPAQSFLGMGGITTIPERMASPHLGGSKIPQPPEQNSEWSIPTTSLPTNYLSATELLFVQGMADPRGCNYREIEIGTGNIWNGDGGIVKTHGWVLPSNGGQQFAVSWNGLVYPAVSVGASADLHSDVRVAIQKTGRIWANALPEGYTVSYESCLPIKGCLLLRLGELELAKDIWAACQIQAGKGVSFDAKPNVTITEVDGAKLPDIDPYVNWASDWAWGLFDRAITAHMRGDDALALASASMLATAQPKIETTAKQRGFKRQPAFSMGPWNGEYQNYLNFLGPLPALLADQERRAKRREPEMTMAEIEKMTNQPARISALIDQLDQFAVRQWGQPGGLGPLESEPVVAALFKEGSPAIEPLIQCLEGDSCDRLTRAVSFGRDFSRDRYLHPVSEQVDFMLHRILGVDRYGTWATTNELAAAGTNQNRITAAQIRAWMRKFNGISPEERWYIMLLDDNVDVGLWAEAAVNITKQLHPNGDTNITVLQGESLRAKQNPSVSKLLEQRFNEIMPANISDPPFGSMNALRTAGELIAPLTRWDVNVAIPLLHTHMKIAVEASDRTDFNFLNYGQVECLGIIIGDTMTRIKYGDTNALKEYAQWIQSRQPGQAFVDQRSPVNAGVDRLDQLKPAWMFPNDPAIVAALEKLLAEPGSPWRPSLIGKNGTIGLAGQLVATPLLTNEVVRKYMLAGLAEKAYAGNITFGTSPFTTNDISIDCKFAAGWGTGETAKLSDKLPKNTMAPMSFRVCDLFAEQLASVDGFPPFEKYWSLKERDTAITAITKFIKANGNKLGELVEKKRKREWWKNQ